MIDVKTIETIVAQKIAGSHMFIVEVSVNSQNSITVFVDSETAVTLDDCVELSKHIESQLDRDVEDFELSVSSAGLSEPLKVARQFIKNIGKEVEIVTKDGQKRIGILVSYEPTQIVAAFTNKVKLEGFKRKQDVTENVSIPFDTIKSVILHISLKR